MPVPTFDELIKSDLKEVFLNGDFSKEVIYTSGADIKIITIQFFESSLDKLDTSFYHAWALFDDMPRVIKGDTLTVNNVIYGIVDSSVDEFASGINLFLQEIK